MATDLSSAREYWTYCRSYDPFSEVLYKQSRLMWCEALVRTCSSSSCLKSFTTLGMSVKIRYFLGLATLAWSHYGQGSEFVLAASAVQNSATTSTVPSSYAVPGAFPTSLYSHYYNNPTATSAQPQPVISDPVTVILYCNCYVTETNSLFSMKSFHFP